MTVKLNHTIVAARDKQKSALFLSGLLGLGPPQRFGPFVVVSVGDELTLDFVDGDGEIVGQHYAFLVSETEFDEIFDRIKNKGFNYWADPSLTEPGRVNCWDDGRGVYFLDPDGHLLEILTRPYGSKGTSAEYPHPLVLETITPPSQESSENTLSGGDNLARHECPGDSIKMGLSRTNR